MKICQIMAGNEEGGLENHFVELCNGLSKINKLQVTALAHKKYADRFNSTVQFFPIDLNKGRKNPFVLFKLLKLIKKTSADIIHAHANKATSMLASLRYFLPGKKVATVHSLKKKIRMFEKMDLLIGVSGSVLEHIQHNNKKVVFNGVPRSFFSNDNRLLSRESLGINNNLPLVLSVGRLVPVKGVDVLIKAWTNVNANLLIVGEGKQKEMLQQLANNNNKIDNVYFLGFREDIHKLMQISDLTVISSYREGFSYVVAESLLSNTPVVSTNVPGANEILPKKYIVDTGDPLVLQTLINDALLHLVSMRKEFIELYKFARYELTEDKMIKKTSEIYQSML